MRAFVEQVASEVDAYLGTDRINLPAPLSKDDERRLFDLYINRHINKKISRKKFCKILVLRNLLLARKVSLEYYIPGIEEHELFNELVTALANAAVKFKPELGNAFSTYAMYALQNCAHRLYADGYAGNVSDEDNGCRNYRSIRRMQPNTVLTEEIKFKSGDEASPVDSLISGHREQLYHYDELEILKSGLAELNEMQALVITGRFVDGKGLKEIAEEVNLSKERIRQIEAAALLRLKVKFGGLR